MVSPAIASLNRPDGRVKLHDVPAVATCEPISWTTCADRAEFTVGAL